MNPFRPRTHGPLSLQTRLMAAVTGFVSLILVVIAIATSVVLGNVLNGRLQDELSAASKSLARAAAGNALVGKTVPDAESLWAGQTGVPTGTLVMVVSDTGAVTGSYVNPDRVAQDLGETQLRQVITALNEQRYQEEVGGLGSYQLAHQSVVIPGTPRSFEVVTGLPRASVEAQITTLFSMLSLIHI